MHEWKPKKIKSLVVDTTDKSKKSYHDSGYEDWQLLFNVNYKIEKLEIIGNTKGLYIPNNLKELKITGCADNLIPLYFKNLETLIINGTYTGGLGELIFPNTITNLELNCSIFGELILPKTLEHLKLGVIVCDELLLPETLVSFYVKKLITKKDLKIPENLKVCVILETTKYG